MLSTHDSSDPIRILEALYDLERPRDTWFRGVVQAAGSALDQGFGVGMLLYDVSGSLPRVDAMQGFNLSAESVELGADSHAQPDWGEEIVRCYRSVVCATMDEHVPDPNVRAVLRARYAPMGLRDQLLVNGANRSGLGCALYVFSGTMFQLTPGDRGLMTRLAAHLSSAYRLHRRLEHGSAANARELPAAILNVDGRVEHAEAVAGSSESRECLTHAVKLREAARTLGGRRDPDRAIRAWKPLVNGRWSLVDSYESDGRRYITARENAPAQRGFELLSPREREVARLAEQGRANKEIAYELGLGHSTVRVLLARAASKVGVRTRVELIAQLRASQQVASTTVP